MRRELQRLSSPTLLDRFFAEWPDNLTQRLLQEEEIRVEEERNDDSVIIRADMPGVDPDKDIEITTEDGNLRIRAERKQQHKIEEGDFYRSEIRYGSFVRVLPLPSGATEADVQATYRDGVLEVTVPVARETATKARVPITKG